MSTEFNIIMKHYNKLAAGNYKKTGPNNEQWDRRHHKSSTDASMVKVLAYKRARINKDALIMLDCWEKVNMDPGLDPSERLEGPVI